MKTVEYDVNLDDTYWEPADVEFITCQICDMVVHVDDFMQDYDCCRPCMDPPCPCCDWDDSDYAYYSTRNE